MLLLRAFAGCASLAAAATTTYSLPMNQLLNGQLQQGNQAMIDLGVIADVLGPKGCSTSQLIGLETAIVVQNMLSPMSKPVLAVCACLDVLPIAGASACPQCPMYSDAICASAKCGCACQDGYYASTMRTCLPVAHCAAPNTFETEDDGSQICTCDASAHYSNDGKGGCECSSGYFPSSTNGGSCVLAPSAFARRAKKSHLSLGSRHFTPSCPEGETACPLKSGGFECLDTQTSLDACGSCPGQGETDSESESNCMSIPGALGVSCHHGRCRVASCFPGFTKVIGATTTCERL